MGPLRHSWGLQKGSFWPQKALLGAPEVLGGPRGFRFGPNCRRLVHLGWTHGYHTLWPGIGPLPGPRGLQKGPKYPFSAKLRPLAATIRPNINPKCVVTMSLTQADQLAAVGTKSGPLGPSDDLRGLQKGHFGPKRALLGAQKRPDTRPKCVVTMITSLSDQSAAVGTKSGPPGPTEDLRGHQKGLSGLK